MRIFTLSLDINFNAVERTRRIGDGAPTCPIADGQVVPFLQDDIQLVHGWTWRTRCGLRITGPHYADALSREVRYVQSVIQSR